MNPPLVSIIIPLYNAEGYITETIASALNQTWRNKEIIIVDDGSTDNSLAVAKKFEHEDIKIFSQANKGASAARNKGLAEAKGDYIQFLDADDLLSPNKIENQVALLQGKSNSIANCATVYFLDGEAPYTKQPIHEWHHQNWADNVYFLLKLYDGGDMVAIHAWLTPRAIIDKAGPWDENLTVDDDGEYFCRVVLSSQEIIYSQQSICYYRKYKNGRSLSNVKNYNANKSLLLSTTLKLEHLQKKTNNPLVNKAIARLLMENIVMFYPAYKDLYTIANNLLKKLGGTDYVPILGGKQLELLKKLLGWKVARLLSYYKNRFITNG
jgi:glycosyltransferase involved in cell wall biosynthesis